MSVSEPADPRIEAAAIAHFEGQESGATWSMLLAGDQKTLRRRMARALAAAGVVISPPVNYEQALREVREQFPTLNRILCTAGYDGKAVQAEAWEAFQEISRLRAAVVSPPPSDALTMRACDRCGKATDVVQDVDWYDGPIVVCSGCLITLDKQYDEGALPRTSRADDKGALVDEPKGPARADAVSVVTGDGISRANASFEQVGWTKTWRAIWRGSVVEADGWEPVFRRVRDENATR